MLSFDVRYDSYLTFRIYLSRIESLTLIIIFLIVWMPKRRNAIADPSSTCLCQVAGQERGVGAAGRAESAEVQGHRAGGGAAVLLRVRLSLPHRR